jgi:hypothetical protein
MERRQSCPTPSATTESFCRRVSIAIPGDEAFRQEVRAWTRRVDAEVIPRFEPEVISRRLSSFVRAAASRGASPPRLIRAYASDTRPRVGIRSTPTDRKRGRLTVQVSTGPQCSLAPRRGCFRGKQREHDRGDDDPDATHGQDVTAGGRVCSVSRILWTSTCNIPSITTAASSGVETRSSCMTTRRSSRVAGRTTEVARAPRGSTGGTRRIRERQVPAGT